MSVAQPVSQMWSNKGFMDMPEPLLLQCLAGLLSIPDREPDDFDELARASKERFLMCCERWVRGSGLRPELHRWDRMMTGRGEELPPIDAFYPTWSLKTPTIADLDVGPDHPGRVYVTKTSGEERWLFYPYAFGIFWALLYHESTERLRRPDLVWRTLDRHWNLATTQVRRDHTGLADLDDAFFRQQFLFALYERVLGLHYDVAQNLAHYRANIAEREGLSPTEREERARVFQDAIDWFLSRVTTELFD